MTLLSQCIRAHRQFIHGLHLVPFRLVPALMLTLALMKLLSGCATLAEHIDAQAQSSGFVRSVVFSPEFKHIAYKNYSVGWARRLHVYLEGDGSPWVHQHYIAADPTPHNALMLELMAVDENPSVYVSRPCYLGLADSPGCGAALWTSARYGERVVASLAHVINALAEEENFSEVVLLGHSGGGTLAMLLAERLDNVRALVTVAANLDIDAWTSHHRYAPLVGSLNPALRPPLEATVWQLHLIGAEDDVVLPESIRSVARRQPNARFRVVEGFDHHCCWEEIWREVLTRLPYTCLP